MKGMKEEDRWAEAIGSLEDLIIDVGDTTLVGVSEVREEVHVILCTKLSNAYGKLPLLVANIMKKYEFNNVKVFILEAK